MKYAAFKTGRGRNCLFLWYGRLPRLPQLARRRGPGSPRGDPQHHIKKIDPSLDLKGGGADQRGQRQLNCWPVAMWMPTTSSMFPI